MMETNYTENQEQTNFPELDRVVKRFKDTGRLKPELQVRIYEAVSRCWGIGKAIVDVGCGIGIGTNILARDAVGALGIDREKESIEVAQQLYGSPRISFAQMDATADDFPRPMATADVVVCLEVIEHIEDYEALLRFLKKFYHPKRRTVFFISSPNRNNPELLGDHPKNPYHVREWTAGEFYAVLTKHFEHVTLYSAEKLDTFDGSETVDGDTTDTPILAKCEVPINV